MHKNNSHKNYLSKSRFSTVLFIIRMSGIPFNMEAVSTVHSAYNVLMVMCIAVTYSAFIMELLAKKHKFEETVNNIRVMYVFVLPMWMHLCVR
jgi:hypothetical protein